MKEKLPNRGWSLAWIKDIWNGLDRDVRKWLYATMWTVILLLAIIAFFWFAGTFVKTFLCLCALAIFGCIVGVVKSVIES
jgi:uncharacterized membrane protein